METKKYATRIVNTLVNEGYVAYFAGGWVRDFIMNRPSADIDLATNAPPEKVRELFPKTIQVGAAFGVVIVSIEGHPFEVATFRRDLEYIDGRRPTAVEQSTPEEDALRRDFTINGMFYDPLEGKIFDYVGGQNDIERRIIRTIGPPEERFREDRLRMIRAVRFAARLDFMIDPETERAISCYASTLFPAVAMERVWQELQKMAETRRLDRALFDLYRLRLLEQFFPALKEITVDLLAQYVTPFNFYPADCPSILYLMALFPDASLEEQLAICRYLRTSSRDAKWVEVFNNAKKLISSEDDVAWAHLFADPHAEICFQVLAASQGDPDFLHRLHQRHHRLASHVLRISENEPLVTAAHLKKKGVVPGEAMGKLLQAAERIAITHNLEDPDQILKKLQQSSLWP